MSCVVSSRTWGGGEPRRCPICARPFWVEPSVTVVAPPCPACGMCLAAPIDASCDHPGIRLRTGAGFPAGTDREENCASPPGGGRRDKAVREQAEVSPTGALAGGSLGRLARHLSTPLFRFHIPHPSSFGRHSAAGHLVRSDSWDGFASWPGLWSAILPGEAKRDGGRQKGTSLISTICEGSVPRRQTRKGLMQAA